MELKAQATQPFKPRLYSKNSMTLPPVLPNCAKPFIPDFHLELLALPSAYVVSGKFDSLILSPKSHGK